MTTNPRPVRSLRHWKQRFDPGAQFIWRRAVIWNGEKVKLGSPVPQALLDQPTKLRRFWESSTIELAQFEAPDVQTGEVTPAAPKVAPEDLIAKEGNAWTVQGFDKKLRTKKEALAKAAELIANPPAPKPEGLALIGETVAINDEELQGEDVLAFIIEEAGMDVSTWNAQTEDDRNATISQGLQWMEDLGEDEDDEEF